MSYLARLRQAEAYSQQLRESSNVSDDFLLESMSNYTNKLDVGTDEFLAIQDDKFDDLLKDKDKVLKIINSSPTATSYTDVVTGKTEKGKVVDFKETPNGIVFEVQGKQGIVPKTLGFSNDPNDVVMALDKEQFKTILDGLLQTAGQRLSAQGKSIGGSQTEALGIVQGVRRDQANSALAAEREGQNADGQNADDGSIQNATSLPDAMVRVEKAVETEQMSPAQGFAMLAKMATDFNAAIQNQREEQGMRLQELDDQIRDLKPKTRTKTESKIMPGDKIPIRVASADQSEPQQAQKDLEAAQKERQELTTRIGNTNVVFPMGSDPTQLLNFIDMNADLFQELGGSQENLDKARAAIFKYEINEPGDLKKLPEYDAELDINKVEIAASLAVLSGGDIKTEMQESLNLLETGNVNINRKQVQEFNRTSDRINNELENNRLKIKGELKLLEEQANFEQKQQALENFNTSYEKFITALTDVNLLRDGKLGGVSDITQNEGNIRFKEMVDIFTEAERNNALSEGMINRMRTVVGQAVFSNMLYRGKDDRGLLEKLFTSRGKQDQTLGDMINNVRGIYERNPRTNKPQLKKVIFVENGRQVGNAIEGGEFIATYNDLITNVQVGQFIKPYSE